MKIFSVDRGVTIGLVGVGATAFGMLAGSGVAGQVNDNVRDAVVIVGALALAGWGGEKVRAVALGLGGGAVASLIMRNIPSVG